MLWLSPSCDSCSRRLPAWTPDLFRDSVSLPCLPISATSHGAQPLSQTDSIYHGSQSGANQPIGEQISAASKEGSILSPQSPLKLPHVGWVKLSASVNSVTSVSAQRSGAAALNKIDLDDNPFSLCTGNTYELKKRKCQW